MKTTLLLPIVASALVVGCTQKPDSPWETEYAVRFRSFVVRPDRGVDIGELGGINFGLWAYQGEKGAAAWSGFAVASNAQVLDGGAGGYEDPNQTVYWPSQEALLGFYAYAPYSAGAAHGITKLMPGTVGVDVVDAPSFYFVVSPKVAEQVDLLVARSEGLTPVASVPLTFRHALTKPTVVARVTAPNWRVAITEIVFAGIANQGTFTYPVLPPDPNLIGTWNVHPTRTDFYSPPLAYNGQSDPSGPGLQNAVVLTTDHYVPLLSLDPGYSLFLLPQTLGPDAVLAIRYNVYSISSGTQITGLQQVPISLAGEVWNPGSQVSYRLSFDPKPAGEAGSQVHFSPVVVGWDAN